MKNVYIVLTHTGTILSKIIKSYTKDEFSHVSISLDINLDEMYSFGRLNPYIAFIGGFVHEEINKGTFKRFYKTKTKIYSLPVTDDQYNIIQKSIEEIRNANYKFNIIGLIAVGFDKRINAKRSFYCAEFVKYLLSKAGIETNLPEIVKPEHFKNINGIKEIYSGLLKNYNKENITKMIASNIFMKTEKAN